MEQFYYIVLAVAIVFLIIVLIFVGIMMQGQNKNQSYPPVSKQCPDFWVLGSDNTSCIVPGTQVSSTSIATSMAHGTNTGTLHNTLVANGSSTAYNVIDTSCNTLFGGKLTPTATSDYNILFDTNTQTCNAAINPASSVWTANGLTANCSQKQWTSQVGVQWDGTSNYNGC